MAASRGVAYWSRISRFVNPLPRTKGVLTGSPIGLCINQIGDGGYQIHQVNLPSNSMNTAPDGATFLAVVLPRYAMGTTQEKFCSVRGAGAVWMSLCREATTGELSLHAGESAGEKLIGPVLDLMKPVVVVGTWKNNGSSDEAKIYIDGAEVGSSVGVVNAAAMSGAMRFMLCGSTYWPTTKTLVRMGGFWRSVWPPDLVLDVSRNPELLIAPKKTPVFYSLPGGAGIPTLSLPGVQDITAVSARPRVTLTY